MQNEDGKLAVALLGATSIVLVIGIVICFLAVLGYNTYIKYTDQDKKIEVHAENSNLTTLQTSLDN